MIPAPPPEFADNLMGPLVAFNVGDPAAVGAGRANYRTATPELLAELKAATTADVTDEQFVALLNIRQPDESLGQADHPVTRPSTAPRHGRSVGRRVAQLMFVPGSPRYYLGIEANSDLHG
ncbi:hypothetical protein ACQEUU_04035 [Nonomuraea sp. CA-218870]|uniref:hypothetical protein n=1 Tax=Nonomuraea sp. CA-218870 TaxID=3239998 RepID=UPI003D93C926